MRSNTRAAAPHADARRPSRAVSIDTAWAGEVNAAWFRAWRRGWIRRSPAALRLPPRTISPGLLMLVSAPSTVPIFVAASIIMRWQATFPDAALLTRLRRSSISNFAWYASSSRASPPAYSSRHPRLPQVHSFPWYHLTRKIMPIQGQLATAQP